MYPCENPRPLDRNAMVGAAMTGMARRQATRAPSRTPRPHDSYEWTAAEMNQLLVNAGVLPKAGVYGFRAAAGEEFQQCGFRLATIRQEREPQNQIHHLSLYALTDGYRIN